MLLDDGLGFLVAQRLQDRRQQLVLPVAHALLMDLAQLGHLGGELFALLWRGLKLVEKHSGLLVVGKRRGHQPLGGLVFPEHRKQVLLFEPGEQIQLRLEIREQPLACLDRTVRGIHELGEELVGLGRTGLKQLSDGRHVVLMENWSQTQY